MRRIYKSLGRGRRHICVANGRPVCIQLRRRAVEAPAPTGIIKPFASPINQNLADDRAEMQKICIDLVGAHYVRPRANAVRPYGHCVTVYVSAKSKFTVRSGRTQRVYTNLGSPANGFGSRNAARKEKEQVRRKNFAIALSPCKIQVRFPVLISPCFVSYASIRSRINTRI